LGARRRVATRLLRTDAFDLLLLDLGLPRKGGLQVLQALRARQQALPVLIITARMRFPTGLQDWMPAADDYLVKPFDLDELAARIRALLAPQIRPPRARRSSTSGSG